MQFPLLITAFLVVSAAARAESLCAADEIDFFSCALNRKGKIVSLCGAKDLAPNAGYLQYRFGTAQKIEMTAPKEKTGRPDFTLTRSRDNHAEYVSFRFDIDPFSYEITSFRQFTPKNAEGYPTPPSENTLSVMDARRSMREGNFVFNDSCAGLGAPIDALEIARRTGVKVEKGGF
jgi:hypothetical protein